MAILCVSASKLKFNGYDLCHTMHCDVAMFSATFLQDSCHRSLAMASDFKYWPATCACFN